MSDFSHSLGAAGNSRCPFSFDRDMKFEHHHCRQRSLPAAVPELVRCHYHRMKKRTKRILISALLATLLEAILVGLATVAQRTSNGQDIFTFCLMPFYMIAAVLTHNAEDTSGVLIYSLMFLFFLGITYLAQVMWARIRKP
jgi:uncharacterized membrane-anchored protein YitT (DUF2179 family)